MPFVFKFILPCLKTTRNDLFKCEAFVVLFAFHQPQTPAVGVFARC